MHFDICKLAACTPTWRTVRLSEPVTSHASQEYAYDRSGSVKKEGENAEFYFWNTQITLMVLAEHLALKGNVAECGFVTRSQPALKYY